MTPAEYLGIPYVLTMEPVIGPDGHWTCHAEYPELPHIEGEAVSPLEALDALEEHRVQFILEKLDRGELPPAPRPPLPYLMVPEVAEID